MSMIRADGMIFFVYLCLSTLFVYYHSLFNVFYQFCNSDWVTNNGILVMEGIFLMYKRSKVEYIHLFLNVLTKILKYLPGHRQILMIMLCHGKSCHC